MHFYVLHLLLHVMLQEFVRAFSSVAIFIVFQQNEEKLQEFGHDTKKLRVEVLGHVFVKLLVGCST